MAKNITSTSITLYNDGYNSIVFKHKSKMAVIGLNISSFFNSSHKVLKAETMQEAKKKGIEYINKFSKKKIIL